MSDEAYEAFMQANYDDSEPIKIEYGVPRVEPFDDPEFYEPGTVAVVKRGDRTIIVDNAGERLITYKGEYIEKAHDFRSRFPDGRIPNDGEDGTHWESNGWFEFYVARQGEDVFVNNDPAFGYDEAIDVAKKLLDEHDLFSIEK